jgi:hypothetical protein
MMISKLLVSVIVLATASTLALVYLRRGHDVAPARYPLAGHRPWRKLGAAICLLISVMFVLGIYVVDIPDRPIPYAIYWLIMLGLVVWLTTLALKDIMYTRELVHRFRNRPRRPEGLDGKVDVCNKPGPQQQ